MQMPSKKVIASLAAAVAVAACSVFGVTGDIDDVTEADLEAVENQIPQDYLTEEDLEGYALESQIPDDYLTAIPDEYLTMDELADAIAALEPEVVNPETTRWSFDSLYIDGGSLSVAINRQVDQFYDADTDGVTWDYTLDPTRIEGSDFYEIVLTISNSNGYDITIVSVNLELTMRPKEYIAIDYDGTYLDSDSSPYTGWDSYFSTRSQDGATVCRYAVFTSDNFSANIPASGSISVALVLELQY